MEIKITEMGEVTVITPIGELTNDTALGFKQERENLIKQGKSKFVLNLEQLNILSSIGIRECLSLFKDAESKGGGVRLFNPRPQVKDVFKTTGLLQVFKLYDNLDEARLSFS